MRNLIMPLGALLAAACVSAPAEEVNLMSQEQETVREEAIAPDTAPHLWLEEVEGEAALAWVTDQNSRTLGNLQADARYPGFEAAAISVLNSPERIPYGSVRDGHVYNFWQDEANVRGIWRRTPLASYATNEPEWETLIDFDRLAREENANWVYKGSDCRRPEPGGEWRCLIALSDGGKDAVVNREFSLSTLKFVEDGFVTDEAKQGVAWAGPDTILIATDWGEGSLTRSGYPLAVRRWQRGTPLSDAQELLRGDAADVGVWPMTMTLEDGRILQGAVRSETFFTRSYFWFPDGETEAVVWPLPPRSTPNGIYKGHLLFTLEQDWSPEGQLQFRSGDLLSFPVGQFLETRKLPEVSLAFRPSPVQAVKNVAIAKGAALLSVSENVIGRVLKIDLTDEGWQTSAIDLPGTGEVGIVFADENEHSVFLNYEDFLTPDTLLSYDALTAEVTTLKSLPAKFDASGLAVSQFQAVSTDGTRIPYFLVHREDIPADGSTPVLLYGYGGFQVSMTPGYNPVTGRLWLEQGGAYVLANIRGGGEFGPGWHQAGLKQNRQRIYDDFIAVAEDLIARDVTRPERLGIMGGSNGGLLMGVMLNQRPDLWNAVVVQVPLLDMLRYHLLLAGASWVDEYGSPDIAEERSFLEQISPYHNFDPARAYPPPFFVTSTKDDRVHPGHARKMARLFEEAGLPFFYYENMDGGHAAAADQQARARRVALEFTYLARQLFPETGTGE